MIAIPNRDGTGRLRAQRGDWEAGRRALDCGEFSPLWAGDLSPSECGPATKPNARLTAGASRERAHSSRHPGSLDGDKSPRESGDQSPHSKTRLRATASGRCASAPPNHSGSGFIPNFKNAWYDIQWHCNPVELEPCTARGLRPDPAPRHQVARAKARAALRVQ
jgi:hypothetical protein